MVGAHSFSQPFLCVQLPLKSPPEIGSSTSDKFDLPIHPYLFVKSSWQSPLRLLSSLPRHRFTSQHSTPKVFSRQRRLRQETRGLRSIVRTNAVLISFFFLKKWTVITELTTTSSPYHWGSENWCLSGSSIW